MNNIAIFEETRTEKDIHGMISHREQSVTPHPEYLYILKTSPDSVSEITTHKVNSYSIYGKRQVPKPECIILSYEIEGHYPVEIAKDETFRENMHLMSTIGNTDPWTGSTFTFRNLEDANIRREKEILRLNKI